MSQRAEDRAEPRTDVVRLAAAIGRWDEAADSYLVPGNSAGADCPGGAGGL